MIKINKIFGLLLFLGLFSCQGSKFQYIEGSWIVDKKSMKYQNESIGHIYFDNSLLINSNGNLNFPVIKRDFFSIYGVFCQDSDIEWTYFEDNDKSYLSIDSKCDLFSGDYEINFWKNRKNQLRMSLKSDDCYFESTKIGLFSKGEVDYINSLEIGR
jgi:hypothetical protein